MLRFGRDVRKQREVYRRAQGQARRHLDLRAGIELHDLASGKDEFGYGLAAAPACLPPGADSLEHAPTEQHEDRAEHGEVHFYEPQ